MRLVTGPEPDGPFSEHLHPGILIRLRQLTERRRAPETHVVAPGAGTVNRVATRRRSDIQGLRAVAILSVVAYHASSHLSGGFTGVDVFFVISGFVITGTLSRELETTGRIRLLVFYGRRARRLLPALAAMVTFTCLVAILANPVVSQHAAAVTGIWATLFSANAFFYRLGNGYFDLKATLDPLLHTWSLAVEEQFYVFFPTLLAVAWRLGSRRSVHRLVAFLAVATITLLSFALSLATSSGHLLAARHRPQQFAFYGSPTRAWEFGVGALLALAAPHLPRMRPFAGECLGIAGAAAVVIAAIAIRGTAGFPGTAALYPVLGAAAVIAAGSSDYVGRVSRVLATAPLQWIGDRSYSWYLWHWPLIVFAVAIWPRSGLAAPVAAAVSLLPAAASYRWIENPIRFSPRIRRLALLGVCAVCVAVPIAASVGLLEARGLLAHTTAIKYWQESQAPHLDAVRGCESANAFGPQTPPACTWRVSGARGTIVLIGDSNASHFTEAVVAAGRRARLNVTVATFYGCPLAVLRIYGTSAQEGPCRRFVDGSLAWLERTKPNLVVTAARSDGWLNSQRFGLAADGHAPVTGEKAKAQVWEGGLRLALQRLNRAGVPVVVVAPVPEIPTQPSDCAVLLVLAHACHATVSRVASDAELHDAIEGQERAIAAAPDSFGLNLTDAFCSRTRCSSAVGNRLLYYDSDHLSVTGSRFLTARFYDAIRRHVRRSN